MKIGDKVVCVDAKSKSGNTGLVEGEIYQHLGIGHDCNGRTGVHIKNGNYGWGRCPDCGLVYHGWNHYNSNRFRPIEGIGDEVEEYILEKVRKEQTVEV